MTAELPLTTFLQLLFEFSTANMTGHASGSLRSPPHGDGVLDRLTEARAEARQKRMKENRARRCALCG